MRPRLTALIVLALLPSSLACSTVGLLRHAPADRGIEARYALDLETATRVATEALEAHGVHLRVNEAPDANTRVLVGHTPMYAHSWGEVVRVRLQREGEGVRLRVASDRALFTNVFAASEEEMAGSLHETIQRLAAAPASTR